VAEVRRQLQSFGGQFGVAACGSLVTQVSVDTDHLDSSVPGFGISVESNRRSGLDWSFCAHLEARAATHPEARRIGGLRRPFLRWISEFPTHRISMSVNHWHPKPALNPETSKKE
jgi:hypothetical protein